MDMEEQSISLERHSRKDKFHLLRVPKGFDIKQLDGITYDPEQILAIETNRDDSGLVTMHELGAFPSQSMDLNVLVKSEDKIKIGPVIKQNFSITKTVHMDQNETNFAVASLQSTPSGNVSFPKGLRERFTPFGRSHPKSQSKKSPSKKKKKKKKRSLEVTSS